MTFKVGDRVELDPTVVGPCSARRGTVSSTDTPWDDAVVVSWDYGCDTLVVMVFDSVLKKVSVLDQIVEASS